MFCNGCGKEIKAGEQFCKDCETKSEKNNITNNTKRKGTLLKIFMLVIIVCIIGGGILTIQYFSKNNTDDTGKIAQIGSSGQISALSEVSFANMNVDNKNLNLDEAQKEVLKYFDNNYFYVNSSNYNDLQRYPKVYKGSQMKVSCYIDKIIKSTDEEFEALVILCDETYGKEGGYNTDYNLILKSKQLDERLIIGDEIHLYGRYIDINTYEIDNTSYTLPVINAINIVRFAEGRFNLKTITTVSKYIFGNDIKVRQPIHGEDWDFFLGDYHAQSYFYLVTLDNQSNANFKAFDIYADYGYIGYNWKYNNLSNNMTKNLFISADFQHFIVTTYDSGTEHVYIDYFDRDFKKLWSREFDYNSNSRITISPVDYTATQMALVIDNDMYLIDLQTGENIIEPILVGEKIKVIMLSDGILLMGNNNKDAIMKIDYTGTTLFRMNADTIMTQISYASTQIINDKMVIVLNGTNDEGYLTKYIVLNADGTVDMSTTDNYNYRY